jgi:c-di-GMP-related signal transduction protein
MSTPTPESTAAFVSRQPILDLNGGLFGYKLLHRDKDGRQTAPAFAA